MTENNNPQKCYNSLSCVLSVLIIIFVVCAIGWDITVSKPAIRKSIDEIRTEVKDIHTKIDVQYRTKIDDQYRGDTAYYNQYRKELMEISSRSEKSSVRKK